MNAPAFAITALDPMTPTLDFIPITSICSSDTHIQQLRRQHYDPEKLLELAASIKANGVLQPILVRPVKANGTVKFEIVAGERRWIAADRAGMAHIPCNIRDMSGEQVLEAQLVENLQREDLRPLEEAEGYKELMALKGISADDVAALIGKSRAYVFARTKLLDLCAAGRDALATGTLDASKALLIARIRGEKLQGRALKLAQELGAHYSYRRLVEKLREDFMIPLAGAPFAIDDDTLATPKGAPQTACIDCASCSANDPELRRELGTDAHICTDRACFDLKTKLYWNRARRDAEAAGESDEAFDLRENAWLERQEAWEPPSVRQVLGADLPADKTMLAEGRNGRLVELVPAKAIAKLLKEKGAEIPEWRLRQTRHEEPAERVDPAKVAAERAKEDERQKVETEYRTRLFKAVAAKWKGPLKRPDFERIAQKMGLDEGYCEGADLLAELHGGKYDIAKLKEPELLRLIALQPLAEEAEETYNKPGALLEAAQRFKIDVKKIRAEVVKDLKPVSVPQVDAKPAAKAKK